MSGFTCGCLGTGHDANCWTNKPVRNTQPSRSMDTDDVVAILREVRDLLATISQQLALGIKEATPK